MPELEKTSRLPGVTPQYLGQHLLDYWFTTEYELGQEIGRGGYGFVVSAIHRVTRREVAVKFIYKNKLPSTAWEYQDNLPIEISVLKQIRHPNVIQYINNFEDPLYYYLVMELYGSEWESSSQPIRRGSCDLFECIERHHSLSETQAKLIFGQIARCVYDLSEQNIFHRDIKDENIVIDSDFKVKLIDFGSAIRIPATLPRDMFTLDRFHGTISFAAPEILLGISYKPEPAEVWSLGVLLYTLLYGQTPFQSTTQVIAGQWQRYTTRKSSDCMDMLQGLLKRNPQKRMSIKDIVQHPWLSNL
ncbi:kinase-like protein [Backusella circina FSU 941]|nr:kinase-like protein [Backusella circina FSU 941]